MVIVALGSRELGQLRVGDLRAACQTRGLPAYGRKDELMARIVAADKAHAKKQKSSYGRQASPTPSSNTSTALCPTPEGTVSKLPFAGSNASQWCLTSAVDDGIDASSSWRWTWTQSPAGKDALVSPLRDFGLDSVQKPTCSTRRRLRVKSPVPHVLAFSDLSPGSPLRQHAFSSPERRAPRRRLREKSPDPQRYDRDDWSRDFHPARQANSPLALLKVSSSAFEMSPEPCRRVRRRSKSAPERRQRHTTSLTQVAPHLSGSSTASAGKDDPSAVLILLSGRELREMCVECGVPPVGTKMALVQRLVEAHAVSAAPQLERADDQGSPRLESGLCSADGAICTVARATPCAPAVRPSTRLSGGVPLPPSSWVSPQLVDDVNGAQTTSSPEQALLTRMPKSLLPTSPSNSPEVQQATSATPQVAATPLEKEASLPGLSPDRPSADGSPMDHQAPESGDLSADWWHQVKSRWPQIVENLRKRQIGSPSIFEDFQSPKRHCPTPLRLSPMLHPANALEGFR